MVILTVLLTVRHGDLNIMPFQVNDRVTDMLHIGNLMQQVVQTSFREILLSVIVYCKSGIQEHIVPDHTLYKLRDVMIVPEDAFIGVKGNGSTITLGGVYDGVVDNDLPFGKFYFLGVTIPVGLHDKGGG